MEPYFETQDIIDTVLYGDSRAGKETKLLAKQFSKRDLSKLWLFVKENIRYKEDGKNQFVQHPATLWKSKKGDCKSFSLFIGSVLKNMGIPYKYRFVSYKKGDVTHVYVVAMLQGQEIILDAVHHTYNEEVPYYHAMDYTPRQNGKYTYAKVAGIKKDESNIMQYLVLAGIIFIGYKLYKKSA